MYENIGSKLKDLAKYAFAIEAVVAVISGFSLMTEHESLMPIGFLVMLVGALVAWISSWMLYAFGQLVDDVHAIRQQKNTPAINDGQAGNNPNCADDANEPITNIENTSTASQTNTTKQAAGESQNKMGMLIGLSILVIVIIAGWIYTQNM